MKPIVCSPGSLLLLTLVASGLAAAPARAEESPCTVGEDAAGQSQESMHRKTTTASAEDAEAALPAAPLPPAVGDESVDPDTAILQVERTVRGSRIGTEAQVIRRGVQELLLLPDELSPTRLAVLGITLYFTPEPFLERRMDLHRDGGRAKVTVGLAPDRIVVSGAFE